LEREKERFKSVYILNMVMIMTDKELTGKILINDGEKTISVNITGKSENELYEIFTFMRKMKKDPGKYSINLEID
jgi:hypothetical protein